MRLADFYERATGPVISIEVFPPKDDKAAENLRRVLPELVELGPDFMTVTYGALGSTRRHTLETAGQLKHEFGMEVACHLTCVGSSRSGLDQVLTDIHKAGIRNIVALRGDPPSGPGEPGFVPPPDGCAYANELVEHIRGFEKRRRTEPFGIAVAGYPETHIEARDRQTDLRNLKRKVDAGGEVVLTQLFFDNRDFFGFVEEARAQGVTVPIVPGLLPVHSHKQAMRMTSMCGASIPDSLGEELEKACDDGEKSREIGLRHCVSQATELLERGVPGLHFYVLNRSAQITRILERLRR